MVSLQRKCRSALINLMHLATRAAVFPAYACEGLVDGQKFSGETSEKRMSKGNYKEAHLYMNATSDPLACYRYGFPGSSYAAHDEGGT
jgi:hypothetical protein